MVAVHCPSVSMYYKSFFEHTYNIQETLRPFPALFNFPGASRINQTEGLRVIAIIPGTHVCQITLRRFKIGLASSLL